MAEMRANDAAVLLDLFEKNGVQVWVDGGWGVDALLGQQTRPHEDLDVTLDQSHVEVLVELLTERGYSRIETPHDKDHNFVMSDAEGREVDLHIFVFDDNGDGVYGPPENGDMIPAESLTGEGQIAGQQVPCISPEWLLRYHTGYEWDENDRRDMDALAERFDLELPDDPMLRLW
jgi:lincosamide nucleotidyltransferase A/C/D/E